MSVTRSKGTVTAEIEEIRIFWKVEEDFRVFKHLGSDINLEKLTKTIFFDNFHEAWLLTIHPYILNAQNQHFIGIEIICINSSRNQTCASVSLQNCAGRNIMSKDKTILLTETRRILFEKFISRESLWDEKHDLLHEDGALLVQVKLYFDFSVADRFVPNLEGPLISRLREFDDYERLLIDGKYSDAQIVTEYSIFPVHKSILAIRSHVFASMFKELEAMGNSTLWLSDVDGETMAELLRFVYAGKVNINASLGEKLFVVADKFELLGLKHMCENYLLETLHVNNVCPRLALAKEHGAFELIKQSMEFLEEHIEDVVRSGAYEAFIGTCTPRLAKLMNNLVRKP